MANSNTTGNSMELATIDTDPGSGGFWTNPVKLRDKLSFNMQSLSFFIAEKEDGVTSDVTPTLQFRVNDGAWTDFNSDFVIGDVKVIYNNVSETEWRAGVKEGGLTSGGIVLGFNW